MRRATASLICVALAVGCGAQDTTPATTTGTTLTAAAAGAGATIGQRAIETLLAQFPDERIAAGAVVLAADQGYGLERIIEAAVDGRLGGDGRIVGPDGATIPPDGPAAGLLVDDLAELRAEPASLRGAPTPVPVSQLLRRLGELFDERGPLLGVLALLDAGYSAEQITLAVMTDGTARLDRGSFAYQLLDDEGAVILPSGPPLGLLLEAVADSIGLATTTTVGGDQPGETSPTATSDRLTDLVREAVGDYVLTADLRSALSSWDGVVSVGTTDGTLTITPDGRVSGGFAYDVTTGDDEYRCSWSLDFELPPTPLELLDDGLTFSGAALVDERGSCGDFGEFEVPITGFVDVDLGLITVPYGEELDVLFQR